MNDESDRFRNGHTINLLSKWDQIGNSKAITISQIAETVEWIRSFSDSNSDTYIEDLDWSHHHLLNSLEPELFESVLSILRYDYTPSQQGGPLTFSVIIDQVINLSDSAIDHMISNIRNFDIKQVDGENIDTICRRFRYAFKRLENNGSLSNDLTRSLSDVFTKTSHSAFNDLMKQWFLSIENGLIPKPSYLEVLAKAKQHYSNFKCSGLWSKATSPTTSLFTASTDSESRNSKGGKPLKCHWCGGNHIRPNCPKFQLVKDIVNRPPSVYETPISTKPLRYHEIIGDYVCKWCEKCGPTGRWTKSHFTDGHKGKILLQNRHFSQQASNQSVHLANNTINVPNIYPASVPGSTTNSINSTISFSEALAQATNTYNAN